MRDIIQDGDEGAENKERQAIDASSDEDDSDESIYQGPADGNARFLNNLDTSSDDEEYKSGSDLEDEESEESKESADDLEEEEQVNPEVATIDAEQPGSVFEPSSLEDSP